MDNLTIWKLKESNIDTDFMIETIFFDGEKLLVMLLNQILSCYFGIIHPN